MEEVTPISLFEGFEFGGWRATYIGKGKFICIYKLTSDKGFLLDASGDADVKFMPPLLGWRLTRIEWSSDDATSKDIQIKHHPEGLPTLTYPPRIFRTVGNILTDFITFFEENEADYGLGDELEFVVDGTAGKKLWAIVTIQMLRGKLPTETPREPEEVESSA